MRQCSRWACLRADREHPAPAALAPWLSQRGSQEDLGARDHLPGPEARPAVATHLGGPPAAARRPTSRLRVPPGRRLQRRPGRSAGSRCSTCSSATPMLLPRASSCSPTRSRPSCWASCSTARCVFQVSGPRGSRDLVAVHPGPGRRLRDQPGQPAVLPRGARRAARCWPRRCRSIVILVFNYLGHLYFSFRRSHRHPTRAPGCLSAARRTLITCAGAAVPRVRVGRTSTRFRPDAARMKVVTAMRSLKDLLAQVPLYVGLQKVVGADALRYRCLDAPPIKPGEVVVDVGCGPAYYFDRLPQPLVYHGFDTDQKYVEWAREKFGAARHLPRRRLRRRGGGRGARHPTWCCCSGLLHHLSDEDSRNLLELCAEHPRPRRSGGHGGHRVRPRPGEAVALDVGERPRRVRARPRRFRGARRALLRVRSHARSSRAPAGSRAPTC